MWRQGKNSSEHGNPLTKAGRTSGLLMRFISDTTGSVAIYSVFMVALLMGAGVLAIDFGRLVAVRHEMQNMADAAALSAAKYLDGEPGARLKAIVIAHKAIEDISKLADDTDITVSDVSFYSEWIGDGTDVALGDDMDDATIDGSAVFVKVELTINNLTLAMMPVLNVLTTTTGATGIDVTANAVATSGSGSSILCENAVFMTCDPTETEVESDYANGIDIMDLNNIGREIIAKNTAAVTTDAPGNFGLLCPPGDANCGASSIGEYIANPDGNSCTSGNTLITAPGNKLNQVSWGVDAILDIEPGGGNNNWTPAKNVMNYPDDTDSADLLDGIEIMGNAIWDLVEFWTLRHPGWTPHSSALTDDDWPNGIANGIPDILEDGTLGHPDNTPTENGYTAGNPKNGVTYDAAALLVSTFATRYQVYLYESGVIFQGWHQLTIYPPFDLSIPAVVDNLPPEIETFTGLADGLALVEVDPVQRAVAGATLKVGVTDNIVNRDDISNWTCEVDVPGNGNQPDQTINCAHGDAASSNSSCAGDNAAGFAHNSTCGIPLTGTTPSEEPNRRIMYSAVVNCVAVGISGKTTFTHTGRYLAMFLASTVDDSRLPGNNDEAVLMEIVGPILSSGIGTGSVSTGGGLEVGGHLSVRLVD